MYNLEKIQNENIDILTVDSREVAEMVDTQHKTLLSKIDGINKVFTEQKILPSEYWVESTYKDGSGRSNRNYLITKKGCEFISNKSTGDKGIIFTHRYMTRFEELENIVNGDKSLTVHDATNIVSNTINKAISELEYRYSDYIRPLAVDKARIVKYIKQRLGITKANKDFYLVKERVLILLDAEKWEDVPANKLKNAFSLIDESIDVMMRTKAIQQTKWF